MFKVGDEIYVEWIGRPQKATVVQVRKKGYYKINCEGDSFNTIEPEKKLFKTVEELAKNQIEKHESNIKGLEERIKKWEAFL